MLYDIFAIIAPVFICAMIGYTWVKQGHAFETSFISNLVMNIGAPCLIFSTFMGIDLDREAFLSMASAAFFSMVIFGVVGFGILRLFNLDQRAFLPGQIFPNVGNMGLPLCLLAFGDEGLALGLTYFTVNIVFGFTVGIAISSGAMSVRELLRNPMFWTVIITVGLVFAGIESPAWLYNTTDLLGGLTIPLMLIALGVSLARFEITSLKRSVSLSAMRLGLGFLTGNVIAMMMGLEGVARGILIMQCSMPVAVFAYLFAMRYDRQPEEVAATVVISTIMSFALLPALLWYVLP
ncbi:MAG: AEC family transporter [Gammaproteobacteria bacterium]|nr:AEC family transporter [Gammaproteobacteria bacterium]